MFNKLEIAFAEMDKECAERQLKWVMGRKVALKEFEGSEEYKRLRAEKWQDGLYERRFEICGGKGWYQVVRSYNDEYIKEVVEKNQKAKAEKRNYKIIGKLQKKGINEIGELVFDRTMDGFNGFFKFENFSVEIRVIIAGGYNIQCLHERVLVKC